MGTEQEKHNMEDHQYNYFYKVTNLLNGKYYYGIHSTDDLDDGYMGSGIILRKEMRKYGKENFKKDIVRFFDTREDLVKYESEFVNEDLIRDKNCYNRSVGGTGGRLCDNQVLAKDKFGNIVRVYRTDSRLATGELEFYMNGYGKTDQIKRNLSQSVSRFYSTEDGEIRKEQISKERELYWNSEDGNKMKERISEHNKAYYATEEGKAANTRRIKAITGVPKSEDWKEQHSKDMKEFWNTEKGIELKKKFASKAVCTEHKLISIPKYDLYEILEDGTLEPVLIDAKRIDLVRHFGVKGINANNYIGGKPYKVGGRKYRIEKRTIEGLSVHTYRPSDIVKD